MEAGGTEEGDKPRLHLLGALVLLYAQAGCIEEARTLGERAVTEARGGLLALVPKAFSWYSQAEHIVGNVTDALVHASSAYAIAETESDHLSVPLYAAELACLLALDGELDHARELALSARASTCPDVFVTEVNWRRALAVVAAKEGRTDDAITFPMRRGRGRVLRTCSHSVVRSPQR